MSNLTAAEDIKLANEHGTPLFVLDFAKVTEQYRLLQKALPGVQHYYAIKACDHPPLLRFMHQHLDLAFDMASLGEIKQLRKAEVYAQKTIHSHPIKTDQEIRGALRYGCTTFVIDNEEELQKFIPYKHRVGLLLRLNFCSDDAEIKLAKKFGLDADDALLMIERARFLGLHIKGLSFHVGSQTLTPDAHVAAILSCRDIFQQAAGKGYHLRVLDIGGGFPVPYLKKVPSINDFCAPIAKVLQSMPEHVECLAEPGRFLVATAGRSICRVIGTAKRSSKHWYYLDDGVYGSFSGQIYDGMRYPFTLPQHVPSLSANYDSVLAGPSCDCVDILTENIALPQLKIDDLVVHHMMGAYSIVSASAFNRLPAAKVIVLHDALENGVLKDQSRHDAL